MRCWIVPTLLLAAGCTSGEIIDRVAVSVGTHAITTSDIEREIRLTALLNGEQPDFTAASKRRAAERLVEQALIRREIELSRYPQPESSEIEPMLREIVKLRLGGDSGYHSALKSYGITEQDLKQHLLWQVMLLRFIDLRFRPGVQVSEEDIREYFDKQIKAVSGNGAVSLEDYRDRIEQALTGERADKQLDAWLKEARGHARIVYHPEAFQ